MGDAGRRASARDGKEEKQIMKRWIAAWLALFLLLPVFSACADEPVTSLEQLKRPGIKIGVEQGSAAELTVRAEFPEADILYFNDNPSAYLAVAQGKIDAFIYDHKQMSLAIESGVEGVCLLDETLGEPISIGVGISPVSRIPDLENRLNQFLAEIRKNGTLDDMYRRWIMDGTASMPEIPMAENPTLHLTVGTSGIVPPYTYYKGTALTGYDIELAFRFAAWLNADVSFKVYDYGAIVPAAITGDVDCIMANLNITPERAEVLPFSDVLFEEKLGIMVRGKKTEGGAASTASPSVADYNGKRIGVLTGTLMEGIAKETFPDSEYLYLNSYPDCITALLSNKIDAFLGDEPGLKTIHAEQPEVDYIKDRITHQEYSFAFRKDDPESAALCAELNAFLAKCHADGTIQELEDIWFGVDEERKVVDMSDLTGENGTVRVITTSTDMPFSYIKDNRNVGYDIDLVVRFCRDRGYRLELGDVDFSGRIPAIISGKYDFTTDMNVTPERAEEVLFSDATSTGGVVLAVRSADLAKPAAAGSDAGMAFTSLSQLNGKRIGIQTGTTFDEIVQETLPDAHISYFNSYPDMAAALKAKKIDAFPGDEPVLRLMAAEDSRLIVLNEYMDSFEFGFLLPKTEAGEKLLGEINAWLASIQESGDLDQLVSKWTDGPEERKTLPDYAAFPAPNGTLTLATEGAYAPMNYYRGDEVVGFEIELAAKFCEAYGYGLTVKVLSFDGILPAVQSGKADFAAAGMTITEERKESVHFSIPYYAGGTAMAVLRAEEKKDTSFWGRLTDSFNKTFLREERWMLFLEGIGTTLLITALAILFGTALGFGMFMLCRKGSPAANAVTRFAMWLVQGMPMVVLLMILYYIIFGSVAISGAAVAVIGFALTFGAAVFGLLKMGVGAVDRGQYEAACALGYSDRHTFFRIILPQALPHVLPAYKGEIVGLIKATAIVGYIAVQDLTKMGDIVRSRTYEAFFPLIAITVIYFVLEGLIGFLVKRISVHLNPKRRKPTEILKGVKADD